MGGQFLQVENENLLEMQIKQMGPLKLAFVGDAVCDLWVRKRLVCECNKSVGNLNKMKVEFVCCKGQSDFLDRNFSMLTSKEREIYKWGRNAHVKQFPKHSSPRDYHRATGLECLLGYLYLIGDESRVDEILKNVKTFKNPKSIDIKFE